MARTKAKKTKKKAAKPAVKKTKKTASRTKRAPARTVKKTAAKAVTPPPSTPLKEVQNKSKITAYLSEYSGVSKKEVGVVLEVLANLIHRQMRKGGSGEFTFPGLMKCMIKRKPATKARKGINPFTGEEIMIKAKPARNVVKIRPLKRLKEMAE